MLSSLSTCGMAMHMMSWLLSARCLAELWKDVEALSEEAVHASCMQASLSRRQ